MKVRGFTLLEVMVVIVVIGIIATFAVVQIPANDPAERVYAEARRLAAIMRQQWEEAVLLGQQRGIRVQHNAYTALVLSRDNKKWLSGEALTDESGSTLPSRQLGDSFDLELVVEGRPIELKPVTGQTTGAGQPQILFLSSGELTEFELTLANRSAERTAYRLHGSINGAIELIALP